METTTETSRADPLDRSVAVALDIHYATLDSKLLRNRMDRWDIFATRIQSAAESSDTFAALLERVARKLEVGSLSGDAIASELRATDSREVVRCLRAESVAVVALVRADIQERREARAARDASNPGPLFGGAVTEETPDA